MYRYFEIILIVFMLLGCSANRQIQIEFKEPNLAQKDINFLILKALNTENVAVQLQSFEQLYKLTKNKIYLKKLLFLTEGKTAQKYLKLALKEFKDDEEILKYQVSYCIENKQYKLARKIVKKLLQKDKSSENFMILGSISYLQKRYKNAYKYYKLAYDKISDEDLLLKITTLLDENLNQSKKAIEYLESYIRVKNASRKVYYKLLQIYSNKMNIEGLISTYKRMYQIFQNDEDAKRVIELYAYKKEPNSIVKFLEISRYKPEMLLELYTKQKKYKKAFELSKKLYNENQDLDYLAKVAIYEYEAYKKNINKKRLRSISVKFEKVIEQKHKPLYLNYYGYLLIDHDLDVQKGIDYVELALQKEPNSIYYIDSLAWGLYKQKKCKQALNQMQKIIDNTKEEEIIRHFNIIKKCAK